MRRVRFGGTRHGRRRVPVLHCTAPKSVTISSVTQGNGGNHAYAASGQTFNIPNHDPNVAYPYQSYGSPFATNWSVNYSGPINYENAGCI